ncbi:hypothetical protein LSCM1_01345 [Leishmania martiniquensis]|uniref:Calpain catalytic domain-containing protein n=1 Tax=Leishmania martiniquensis TaxID=1580590 RepID=A0A836GP06_9TRYP|nr:hypothetical protein LSCM1_01345 [Leishmania martiniquensis]
MDGSIIGPTGDEDFVTDAMLEEYMQQSSFGCFDTGRDRLTATSLGSASQDEAHHISEAACASMLGSGLLSAFGVLHCDRDPHTTAEGTEGSVLHRASHRVSTILAPPVGVSREEITSDDSGDFAVLTSDVRDADAYDLIRHYMLYCKQQEKELQALEAECARLEAEQQHLCGAAIVARMTQNASEASTAHTLSMPRSGDISKTGTGTAVAGRVSSQARDDEFGEAHVDPLNACPYMDPLDAAHQLQPYRYGQPAVVGCYTPVFQNGILYRCTAPDGSWLFYNDSQQYKMRVKYIVGASSAVTAGPKASLRQRASGEYEAEVTVWPQETEVLLIGEVNGFKSLSTAVPVDFHYTNPHATASTARARALLNRFAHRTGKSSVSLLTAEDVLECCAGEISDVEMAAQSPDGLHFVDPDFPPCRASLHRNGLDDVFLWDMPWRRPCDYLPSTQRSEVCLFARAVLPTDPCRGDGGDAYLCSAASALAEYPAQVARLFRHPISADAGSRERGVGAYHVTLCHGGWWTPTILDSYLPASLKGPDLGRCSHDLRKLWYPLLEKAYAKLHGSYAAIQCGDPLEALQELTGYPTFRFDEEWAEVRQSGAGARANEASPCNTPSEHLFTFMEEEVHQRGYIVCLSLPDDGPAEAQAAQMGMMFGMSYMVLRLVRHGSYRVLQIRCPTLRPDSSGLWCAESTRWKQEPDLARLCGMDGAGGPELASLWLDWSEALAMFDGGGVCCSRWDWAHDCRMRGFFHDGIPSVVLEVRVSDCEDGAKPVEAYGILSQDDDRGLPPGQPNRALYPLMLCVSSHLHNNEHGENIDDDSPFDQRIRHVCSTDPDTPTDQLNYILGRDTALRVTLPPSAHPYYVVPRALGSMNSKPFTVGLVSSTAATETGRLRVRPVQLPPHSPVFRNGRDFSTEQLSNVAAASFQIRGPHGRVRVGCGTSIG